MSDASEQFDDPALRLALRQAIPPVAAPAGLRARIGQALQDCAIDEPIRLPQAPALSHRAAPRFLRAHRLAIAASILGLLGGAVIFHFAGGDTGEVLTPGAAELQPVAYPLVMQHTGMADNPTEVQQHMQAPAEYDLSATANSLQRQIGDSLPLGTFAAAGWQFHGAHECQLDGAPGTHLVFLRRNQTLSVFILPAQSAGKLADGRLYTTTSGHRPVAGAVRGEWFICLVGDSADGSLKPASLGNLLKQLLPRGPRPR